MDALAARVRRAGAEPLVTWYRPESGGRTELSGRTLANWVDKTANLLDTLGVEEWVASPLSVAHPGHWMSLIWPLAAWQHGCGYRAGAPDALSELVVVGPDSPAAHPAWLTIACSLHPLGLGLRNLPDGVLDFTGEVLAEPDVHLAVPVPPEATAWVDGDQTVSHAAAGDVQPVPGRVLVRPTTAWETLAATLLGPVLGGGSAVVVEGEVSDAELARIAASERVSAAWQHGAARGRTESENR